MFDDFDDDQHDEALARELLGILNEDFSDPPEELPDRTIRKIEAELTSRDLVDLTTLVFLTSFCAPILDLFASFFGHEPRRRDRAQASSTLTSSSPSQTSPSRAPSANDLLSSDETNRDSHDE